MSAPADMQSRSLTSSPIPQGTAMDYETIFGPFTSSMTSNYAPTSSPFGSQTSTSPFHQQTSPPTSGNLGLERLVLNDQSPTQSFTGAGSQGARSPTFPDFDTAMTTFTPTGMPIETMLDTTAMGEPSYFQSGVITEQTARLMRHYIDNLASWMDLSDSRSHFSTVAPKRALTSVLSLYPYLTIANPSKRTIMFLCKTSLKCTWKRRGSDSS